MVKTFLLLLSPVSETFLTPDSPRGGLWIRMTLVFALFFESSTACAAAVTDDSVFAKLDDDTVTPFKAANDVTGTDVRSKSFEKTADDMISLGSIVDGTMLIAGSDGDDGFLTSPYKIEVVGFISTGVEVSDNGEDVVNADSTSGVKSDGELIRAAELLSSNLGCVSAVIVCVEGRVKSEKIVEDVR